MALKLGIQTYQILTNDDEVCIPSLSSILLAVIHAAGSDLYIATCKLHGCLDDKHQFEHPGHNYFVSVCLRV